MNRVATLAMLVILAFGAVLPGYAALPTQTAPLNFVMIVKTLDNPFYQIMKEAAEAEAQRLGVNLVFTAPARETDLEEQRRMIEDYLQKKPDVISITPSGMVEIIPAIVEANKAGVPVLNVDTPVDKALLEEAGGKIEGFIGTDNLEGGRAAGRYMVNMLGEKGGNVAILEGTAGNMNTMLRANGFHEIVDKVPAIKVVASQPANTERAMGMTVTENILEANPDLNAIFATNDLMALGALEAVEARNLADQVKIIGYDAVPEAVEAVKAKRALVATVAQFPDDMGREAVRAALKVKAGEKLPEWQDTGVAVVDQANYKPYLGEPINFVMIVKTLDNPFYQTMKDAAEAEAKKLNVNLVFTAPARETDLEEQRRMIEDYLQKTPDAISITPSGMVEIIPAIIEANKAGVPVLNVDTPVDAKLLEEAGGNVVGFIGTDNLEGGRAAGRYMVKLLGEKGGNVAILEGTAGNMNTMLRAEGFHEIVDKVPAIKVVASQPANTERAMGMTVTENILEANPDLNAIFATNDLMALGALEAVEARNLADQVKIIGYDAVPEAVEAVKAKRALVATIAQYPDKMGIEAVRSAIRVVKGQKIPDWFDTGVGVVDIETAK